MPKTMTTSEDIIYLIHESVAAMEKRQIDELENLIEKTHGRDGGKGMEKSSSLNSIISGILILVSVGVGSLVWNSSIEIKGIQISIENMERKITEAAKNHEKRMAYLENEGKVRDVTISNTAIKLDQFIMTEQIEHRNYQASHKATHENIKANSNRRK
ncbi:hypothetical protein N9917_02455 [Deltaproteobacteria bacterium]|nr:hypothetical protein [Deltaproteobacteria bacterium]